MQELALQRCWLLWPLILFCPGRKCTLAHTTHSQPHTQLDKERLAAALEKQRKAVAASVETDERKRKFNSLEANNEKDVTEEDMEAYRMVKARGEDPFKGAGTSGYDLLE